MMRLEKLHIKSKFKNLATSKLFDFTAQNGISVIIGNNGSGKSNLLEAISSVFAGLYDKKYATEFSYALAYQIDGASVQIDYKKSTKAFVYKVQGVAQKELSKDQLPSMVISAYSGEELRMWRKYYYAFYDAYTKGIITSKETVDDNLLMVFLNKYHWNIALLTMLVSDLEVDDILGDVQVTSIEIGFHKKNVEAFNDKNPNKVTIFAKALYDHQGKLDVDTFKGIVFDTHALLFQKLVVAHLPKEESYRLINSLELKFSDGTSTEDLSEGQKKQIIVKFITRILADQNALVLLDEPDSQIHVTKKEVLKDLLYDDEKQPYVNCLLTTHSPTLTQCFANEHVMMLDDGQLVAKEKQEIIEALTHDFWSKQKQNVFLSSNDDILLVEGKLDIQFIKEAISKLDHTKYQALESLEYIPTGGASGLRLFIDKFNPKDSQKVIAILDADDAGCKEVKEILSEKNQDDLKRDGLVKVESLENTYLLMLPKLERIANNQYEIEDYFPTETLKKIAKEQIDTFKVLKDFSLKKDYIKRALSKAAEGYEKEAFDDFKVLLDKILEIKNDAS